MDNNLRKVYKNYNIICNCEFLDEDLFSKKLVYYYKKMVSSLRLDSSEAISKGIKIDRIMRKYIEDYSFSKKLQNSIDVCSIVNTDADLSNEIFDYAISFSDRYDEDNIEVVTNTLFFKLLNFPSFILTSFLKTE